MSDMGVLGLVLRRSRGRISDRTWETWDAEFFWGQKVQRNEKSQLSDITTEVKCLGPLSVETRHDSPLISSYLNLFAWSVDGMESTEQIQRDFLSRPTDRPTDRPTQAQVQVCLCGSNILTMLPTKRKCSKRRSSCEKSDTPSVSGMLHLLWITAWWSRAVGPGGGWASEAEQGGTETGSGWGIQRRRLERVGLFWEG